MTRFKKIKIKICSFCKVTYKTKFPASRFCIAHRKFLINLEGRDRNRECVRLRDNHTCQKCFTKWSGKGRRFDVHHITDETGEKSKSYESLAKLLEPGYVITLCHKCHLNIDKQKISKGLKKLSTLNDKNNEL
ncbi:MAG: hypothetical protein ACP5N7_07015 [Candidatus Pacearchaeota archaeon]